MHFIATISLMACLHAKGKIDFIRKLMQILKMKKQVLKLHFHRVVTLSIHNFTSFKIATPPGPTQHFLNHM